MLQVTGSPANVAFVAVPTIPPAEIPPVTLGFFIMRVTPCSEVIRAPFPINPTRPPAFPFADVTFILSGTVMFCLIVIAVFSHITPTTPPAFPAANASPELYSAVEATEYPIDGNT